MRPYIAAHRCPNCEIRKSLCFCSWIPRINLQTRVLILMHTSEEVLTSNTAKLAAKALINSELRIHGRQRDPLTAAGMITPGRQSLVLFPSPHAKVLTPEFVQSIAEPITLIVPDASWKQTKKFVRHCPFLQGIQQVKLPPGRPSEYHLRLQQSNDNLCTLEAIARALGIIESQHAQHELETLLRVLVERTRWSRGLLKAHECTLSGIPLEAIHE